MANSEHGLDYQHPASKEIRDLESKLNHYKEILKRICTVVIRGLVLMKFVIRAGSVGAVYFFLSPMLAYYLAGFIVVLALIQLIIDKVRKAINPSLHLSEWDVL